ERLHHRLLRADGLDDRVRAESVGQLLDPLDPVGAAFLDDVGCAELARQALPRLVAAHRDHPLGAELLRREHGEQSNGAVADDRDRLARAGLGGHCAEPAGPEHIGGREQARDQVIRRDLWCGDEGAVGEGDAQPLGLRAQRAHRDAVDAGALVAGPADLARVVGTPERADDELAGHDRLDLCTDLLDDSDVLVPHRCRPGELLDAAIGPQVRAADAGRGHADDRVRRFDEPRLLALLDPHLARAVHHRPTHRRSPPTRRGNRARHDSATPVGAVTYPLVTRTDRAPQPAQETAYASTVDIKTEIRDFPTSRRAPATPG